MYLINSNVRDIFPLAWEGSPGVKWSNVAFSCCRTWTVEQYLR